MSLGPLFHQQTAPEWQTTKTRKYTLQSFVRTDVPGHRNIQVGTKLLQVASGTYRWDAFITQIDTQLIAMGFLGCQLNAGYGVDIYLNSADTLSFPDRLGWLMGYGVDGGSSVPTTADPRSAPFPAPGGVALLGATWTEVTLERERRAILDRHLRSTGYVWGSARLWRLVLTMTRGASEAFAAGWLRAGRVAVVPVGNEAVPLTPAVRPDGYLDGYIVAADTKWIDPSTQRFAEVTAILATTVS